MRIATAGASRQEKLFMRIAATSPTSQEELFVWVATASASRKQELIMRIAAAGATGKQVRAVVGTGCLINRIEAISDGRESGSEKNAGD